MMEHTISGGMHVKMAFVKYPVIIHDRTAELSIVGSLPSASSPHAICYICPAVSMTVFPYLLINPRRACAGGLL